jgi:hypothetical protein
MRFSTRLTPGTFSAATTAACRAFSLIEKALQSYGAVANTDVEPAGRPRSARYRGDDAAPNLLVVLRKALGTDYKAGDRRQKVRIRDNANDLVAAQDAGRRLTRRDSMIRAITSTGVSSVMVAAPAS